MPNPLQSRAGAVCFQNPSSDSAIRTLKEQHKTNLPCPHFAKSREVEKKTSNAVGITNKMFSRFVNGVQRRIEADDRQMDPIYCAATVANWQRCLRCINIDRPSRASSIARGGFVGNLVLVA